MQSPNRLDDAGRIKYRNTLGRLQRFARAMDSKFEIPVLGMRVGWDAIIGLIPGVGDVSGLLMSFYVIVEALRLKAPPPLIGRMIINMLVEFIVGLVPVLGDLFDVYWKANLRNVQLLQRHIELHLAPPPPKQTAALTLVLLVAAIIATVWFVRFLMGHL